MGRTFCLVAANSGIASLHSCPVKGPYPLISGSLGGMFASVTVLEMGKIYPDYIKVYSLVTATLWFYSFSESLFHDYELKCENKENWFVNFASPFFKTIEPFLGVIFITPYSGFNIEPDQNVNPQQLQQIGPPGGAIDYVAFAGDNGDQQV